MWPPRWACSCGRCAGSQQPAGVLVGAAHVDQALGPDRGHDLVPEGSDAEIRLLRLVRGGRPGHGLAAQLASVELPLLATAVQQPHVVVAVQLEVPVRVGREPVVVAAVEDDRVVVADAPLGQQRLELLLVDEVAADRILEILLPIQLDRAGDVAAVIGGGVFVHLDQDDSVVGGVVGNPVGVDENFLPAHDRDLSCVRGTRGERRTEGGDGSAARGRPAATWGRRRATSVRRPTQRRAHPAVVDGQAAGERGRPQRRRGHGVSLGVEHDRDQPRLRLRDECSYCETQARGQRNRLRQSCDLGHIVATGQRLIRRRTGAGSRPSPGRRAGARGPRSGPPPRRPELSKRLGHGRNGGRPGPAGRRQRPAMEFADQLSVSVPAAARAPAQ